MTELLSIDQKLVGHAVAEQAFLDAFTSSRLQHAWLLTGPRGIGKRRFADRVARFLLCPEARMGGGLFGDGPESLDVDLDHPLVRQVEARSHQGVRHLQRLENDKGKLAKEIVIDQVRELAPFLGATTEAGDWRVVLVDAVDDMNRAAANALLKTLEEPPARTLFLLVSHAPGRLLPTVRSRCRRLALLPLSEPQVEEVLEREKPGLSQEERHELVRLAQGCPGRALRFAGLDILPLEQALTDLIAQNENAKAAALSLAEALAAPAAQARYEAFLDLILDRLSKEAEAAPVSHLAPLLDLWEKARNLATSSLPLALDPKTVVFELCQLVAGWGRTLRQS